jgi:hypothetical protein
VRPAGPIAQAADFDLDEFAPGTELPTPKGNATQGVAITAIEQLQGFPRPRFDAAAVATHKIMRNFNWMDASYMAGRKVDRSSPFLIKMHEKGAISAPSIETRRNS